jgi:CBS domain-containing protein
MGDVRLVRDLMTVGVPTCPLDTPVTEIAYRLLDGDLEAVIILDREGHAVGVVSQDELVWAYAHRDYDSLTAEAIMREDIPQIPPDLPLTVAAQIMQDQHVRIFFLMHNAEGIIYPAALLSYRHLLRHMIAEGSEELRDLGIRAERQSPIEAFIKRRDEARRKAQSHQEE